MFKYNKYKNKKTVKYDVKWDSLMELAYYEYLLDLKQAGEVVQIELQPRFLLQESFKYMGKTIRKIEYVADFRITYSDGKIEVVDVKGMPPTADFKLKFKMVKFLNQDTTFKCVRKSGKNWSEF